MSYLPQDGPRDEVLAELRARLIRLTAEEDQAAAHLAEVRALADDARSWLNMVRAAPVREGDVFRFSRRED